jgi:hypothetical protein
MPKVFNDPKYPSKCNVWRGVPGDPFNTGHHAGAPDLADESCEFIVRWSQANNVCYNVAESFSFVPLLALIYFRKGTDVRGAMDQTTWMDTIECPAGSGRFYNVLDVSPVALDFSNEFLVANVFAVELPTPF